MNPDSAVLHDFDKGKQEFPSLNAALFYASTHKVTGYIVTPSRDVIDLRKGKRKAAITGRWVNCWS